MESKTTKTQKRFREDFITVRLSPQELEELRTRAQSLGLNNSNFLRRLLGYEAAERGPKRKEQRKEQSIVARA